MWQICKIFGMTDLDILSFIYSLANYYYLLINWERKAKNHMLIMLLRDILIVEDHNLIKNRNNMILTISTMLEIKVIQLVAYNKIWS